jgi:PAS domain S-box-containing protein
MHPDDRTRIRRAIAEAIVTGADYAAEFRVVWPNGSMRWVLARGRVYRDSRGRVTRMAGIDLDITDRKEAEDALRDALAEADEKQRLLEAVFEALTDGVIVVNKDAVAVRTNPAARAYFGFEPTGMTAAEIMEQLGVEGGSASSAGLKALRGQTVIGAEQFARGRVIETSSAPLRDAHGQVTGAVTISRDVTRRKLAEDALRESESRFRAMADSIPQLAWMAHEDGSVFWYNQRWYDYTGTTFDSVQGWGWRSVHHRDHLDGVVERFQHSLQTGEPWEDTFPLLGKRGEWRWFLSRALPIRNASGEIVTWFGTNTDITEQLQTESALRDSETRFRELAETIPGIVWTARADGDVDYMNSQWYSYTGQEEQQAVGQGWQSVLHADDTARSVARWAESLKSGTEYEIQFRCRRHDGCYRWFLGRGRPLRDSSGQIVKWVGTCTEIHDQKATEQALRRSNEDLQQFAYVASHDLQEPLRIVVSFSQLLMQRHSSVLAGDAEQYLGYLVDAGTRMSCLISDLLAYSRATSDRNRALGVVRLEETLDSALAAIRVGIEETQAVITHDPLPLVAGDARQLRQVFQNLLSNALKYQKSEEPPRIHISVVRGHAEWMISVIDNGQGFAPEYAERIFGIFKRLHGKEVPGTGIGLAICKTVIDRHGGRIWAESTRGKGATFRFTLPILEGR